MARRASVTVMSVGVGLCCIVLSGCGVPRRVAWERAVAMEVSEGNLLGNRWVTVTGRDISFEDA